ncbi:MAG: T9SS type A sorting domain-containing protein [Sphingobacteriales bacterium]|nr:MAG: T9SS type A sorting domain-containing protein [Sphingobacteriales bacterium]
MPSNGNLSFMKGKDFQIKNLRFSEDENTCSIAFVCEQSNPMDLFFDVLSSDNGIDYTFEKTLYARMGLNTYNYVSQIKNSFYKLRIHTGNNDISIYSKQFEIEGAFSVSPTATTGEVSIKSSFDKTKPVLFSFVDQTGRTVLTTLEKDGSRVSLATLTPGAYILVATQGNVKKTAKVIRL